MYSLSKIDNDFTLEEFDEFERRFKQRLSDAFQDPNAPRFEKIAYLGYMRARRDDSELTFDDYLDTLDDNDQMEQDALGGDELLEEIQRERDLEMARFCYATKIAPSEYLRLTWKQRQAFIDVLEERNKEIEKQNRRRGR